MPDETVFEALRDDHAIQRRLSDLLAETHGDSDGRDELFAELKVELAAHAAAEERAFYVPLMEYDLTQEKARHSVAEHHEIDELVEELEETDRSSPHWKATALALREKVEHHLDEEEQEVFQMAGKALSDTAKTDLADEYRREMESQRDKRA
jgi:hemerythrin-like domain-containing protein